MSLFQGQCHWPLCVCVCVCVCVCLRTKRMKREIEDTCRLSIKTMFTRKHVCKHFDY